MDKKIVIAIDGFSSCGKSTFAKAIAKRLGYLYIDSGAMYRVVTLELLRRGLINDGVVDTSMLQSILKEINIFDIGVRSGRPAPRCAQPCRDAGLEPGEIPAFAERIRPYRPGATSPLGWVYRTANGTPGRRERVCPTWEAPSRGTAGALRPW